MPKAKDAQKIKEFDIFSYTKGFVASSIDNEGNTVQEYFQFKEIHKIIHFPGRGVEIVYFNQSRRVFYNDAVGESLILYDLLNNTMTSWMNSNLN